MLTLHIFFCTYNFYKNKNKDGRLIYGEKKALIPLFAYFIFIFPLSVVFQNLDPCIVQLLQAQGFLETPETLICVITEELNTEEKSQGRIEIRY